MIIHSVIFYDWTILEQPLSRFYFIHSKDEWTRVFFQPEDVGTLTAIYKNNRELCSNVSEQLIQHVVHLIDSKERNVVFLDFLQTIMIRNDQPIPSSQDKVAQEVSHKLCFGTKIEWVDVAFFKLHNYAHDLLLGMPREAVVNLLTASEREGDYNIVTVMPG